MNKQEKRKADCLCDEFHKEGPDWELVRQLICDLAGKRLKHLPTGNAKTLQELWAEGAEDDNENKE